MNRLSWILVLVVVAVPAVAGEGVFHAEFIFTPGPELPMNHGASVTEMPDGDLLCAWYAGSEEGARDVKVYASRRDKESGEWSTPAVIADTPERSEGNPVLFVAPDGRVFLFYVTIHGFGWTMAKIKYKTSEDAGRTFGETSVLRERRGWMTRNHPLVLSSGEILLPLYDEVRMRSVFMSSADQGRTWEVLGDIRTRPGNLQPAVVELDDGRLLAVMRCRGKDGHIWRSVSLDQGRTWSAAERMDFPNPDSAVDMIRLKSGRLVMAFNNCGRGRTRLSVAMSEDGGRSWPYLRDLEHRAGEYSYPSLVQARGGLIHVVYTYNRQTIKHAQFDEAWLMGE